MVAEVARALGINETTYYRWRAEYGGMKLRARFETQAGRANRRMSSKTEAA